MACKDTMTSQVNRLAEIKRTQQALKIEQEQIEAALLKQGTQDLSDTKYKSVSYMGTGCKATVTRAESLKVIYPSYLKEIFGLAYKDAVNETQTYKLSAPASRMLVGLWSGNYTRTSIDEVIDWLPALDKDARKVLRKKLKGINYNADKKVLMSVGGYSEEDAESYAYFVAESAVWEAFDRLMNANANGPEEVQRTLALINGACVVEETHKISLETTE